MIEQSIEARAQEFVKKAHPIFAPLSNVQLDFNWPSLGALDALLYSLRGAEEFTGDQREFLKGGVSYLAAMAYSSWASFGGEVTAKDGPKGITLQVRGGPKLSLTESVVLYLEEVCAGILRRPPTPFPVLGEYVREVGIDQNLMSIVGLGVCTGLSPFAKGPWRGEAPEKFEEQVANTVKLLSFQSAEYYRAVFPDEKWGQVAELYLNDLIYPPLGMDEPVPVYRATQGILSFLEEYRIDSSSALRLAHNLALSPDELISCAGLVLYGALVSGPVAPAVRAASEAKGMMPGYFRAAMVELRRELKLRDDWIERREFGVEDEVRLEIERALGFLPWLRLSSERLRKNKNDLLWDALDGMARFDLNKATSVLEKIVEEDPRDIEVRVQRVYFYVIEGDIDAAHFACRALSSEPESESSAQFYGLWGLVELIRGENETAIRYLKIAADLSAIASYEQQQITNNYAWALMLEGHMLRALDVLEGCLLGGPFVPALLNKIYVLETLNRKEGIAKVLSDLRTISPLDRKVFSRHLAEFLESL